jgi:formyltetrahydrofolate deformylase
MVTEGRVFEHVLTISCPDRIGIVYAVTGVLVAHDCTILDSQQFSDRSSGHFFLRIHAAGPASPQRLRTGFAGVVREFGMHLELYDLAVRPRMLIMVSRSGHCLNDLLYRWSSDHLRVDLPAVVSNHEDLRGLVDPYQIPYHYIPVTPDTKPQAEARLLELIDELRIDFVVLARYMQVLSDDLCKRLEARLINIHHSFLPSFAGARPYHQAHARGVKLIGATAHYVTAALDDGPIIEQEVARVDHGYDPEQLAAVGRDVEALALARAVQWHAEHRVLLNGSRTVVFR